MARKPRRALQLEQATPAEPAPLPVEASAPPAEPAQFIRVAPNFLHANAYNPNRMGEEEFQSLVSALRDQGELVLPILVRPSSTQADRYEIIDGEHRWRASLENGFAEIPIVVIEETNERRAKIRTLAMNNVHGENIPLRLAHVLVDLYREYTPEEISALTGVDKKAQDKALESLEVRVSSEEGSVSVDEEAMPVEVTLLLMPEENRDYEIAMHRALGINAKATPLVAHDRTDYTRAMTQGMDLAAVKTRNAALAAILAGFLLLTEEQHAQVKQILARRNRPQITLEEPIVGNLEEEIEL